MEAKFNIAMNGLFIRCKRTRYSLAMSPLESQVTSSAIGFNKNTVHEIDHGGYYYNLYHSGTLGRNPFQYPSLYHVDFITAQVANKFTDNAMAEVKLI